MLLSTPVPIQDTAFWHVLADLVVPLFLGGATVWVAIVATRVSRKATKIAEDAMTAERERSAKAERVAYVDAVRAFLYPQLEALREPGPLPPAVTPYNLKGRGEALDSPNGMELCDWALVSLNAFRHWDSGAFRDAALKLFRSEFERRAAAWTVTPATFESETFTPDSYMAEMAKRAEAPGAE